MKLFLILLSLFNISKISLENHCEKCDIDKVAIAHDHLDSLNIQIVSDFLCTFDSNCIINVEYSEWSNEILYKVLEKSPTIFFQAVVNPLVNNKELLKEIKNPLLDYNFQIIYDKVKATVAPIEIKIKYLNALELGAATDDIKIKR